MDNIEGFYVAKKKEIDRLIEKAKRKTILPFKKLKITWTMKY